MGDSPALKATPWRPPEAETAAAAAVTSVVAGKSPFCGDRAGVDSLVRRPRGEVVVVVGRSLRSGGGGGGGGAVDGTGAAR